MLFVSGTKRSGTSMWMLALKSAGLPILGEAFPRGWERSIKDANPDGFFESLYREGVYWRTNPHPSTGRYIFEPEVRGFGCKVFVPGLIRTEHAYIERVIANVREWREYEASLRRLKSMESGKTHPDLPELISMPAALEWWMENFALVRDLSIRRYPYSLQSYDQVLATPEPFVLRALAGIAGPEGGALDLAAAAESIKPENRTQHAVDSTSIEPQLARVFDDLYAAVEAGKGFSSPFLKTLNETNKQLLPRLRDEQQKVARSHQAHAAARKKLGKTVPGKGIEGLPA
jgi:hypothetical protein